MKFNGVVGNGKCSSVSLLLWFATDGDKILRKLEYNLHVRVRAPHSTSESSCNPIQQPFRNCHKSWRIRTPVRQAAYFWQSILLLGVFIRGNWIQKLVEILLTLIDTLQPHSVWIGRCLMQGWWRLKVLKTSWLRKVTKQGPKTDKKWIQQLYFFYYWFLNDPC